MIYSLIKFKVMEDGSLVLTPWKQHLKDMISELQELKADRHDIGIQYIEPRERDSRIYFYNSNYRKAFIRTNIMNIDKGPLVLWLPDPLIKVDSPFDYTFKPKTDDVKVAMNSIYGVKNMKKLIDTDSIYISTAGYDTDSMTKDFAKLRKLVVDSPFAPKEWTGEGYTKIFEDSAFRMYNSPFTLNFKKDKNLDRVIRHVQVNEKKKVVTIVWKDGEVTMAKCGPNDMWDPEKGVLVCVAKRFFNSNTQFSKWLKSVIPEPEEETKSLLDQIVENVVNKYQPKHSATE
jgi:hypothetical protein